MTSHTKDSSETHLPHGDATPLERRNLRYIATRLGLTEVLERYDNAQKAFNELSLAERSCVVRLLENYISRNRMDYVEIILGKVLSLPPANIDVNPNRTLTISLVDWAAYIVRRLSATGWSCTCPDSQSGAASCAYTMLAEIYWSGHDKPTDEECALAYEAMRMIQV